MLDFNRTVTKAKTANEAVNAEIDAAIAAALAMEVPRTYLGASSLGDECLRKIQWQWTKPKRPAPKSERIFARGRWWETYCAQLLHDAGFRMVRVGDAVGFSQLDGLFKGHADGIIVSGPDVGLEYPCLWECKGLGSKGWTKLSKDGLAKAYPTYADQVALYQAYLGLTENPALFTACNMDTMEPLHLTVPFDGARAQAASDRAVNIISATQAGETLPRMTDDPDFFMCKWCSYRAECHGLDP
jgi:hypothetical protein